MAGTDGRIAVWLNAPRHCDGGVTIVQCESVVQVTLCHLLTGLKPPTRLEIWAALRSVVINAHNESN